MLVCPTLILYTGVICHFCTAEDIGIINDGVIGNLAVIVYTRIVHDLRIVPDSTTPEYRRIIVNPAFPFMAEIVLGFNPSAQVPSLYVPKVPHGPNTVKRGTRGDTVCGDTV
ncbi:hypothetical protein PMJ11TS3_45480 [Paenibacillus melissococcoides]